MLEQQRLKTAVSKTISGRAGAREEETRTMLERSKSNQLRAKHGWGSHPEEGKGEGCVLWRKKKKPHKAKEQEGEKKIRPWEAIPHVQPKKRAKGDDFT